MPDEKTLDDVIRDDLDEDLPDIEISIFDDPDDRAADAVDGYEDSRAPTA
jgi:hypothetical protein